MSKKRNDRKANRREDAVERQAARDALSASEQIARLDKILGKGKGAVKERARLAKQEPAPKKKAAKTKKDETKPKVKQKAKERRASEKKAG